MKKLISLLLCAALCLGCFSGCQKVKELVQSVGEELELIDPPATGETETTPVTEQQVETEPQTPGSDPGTPTVTASLGLTGFDSELIDFLRGMGLNDENFTVSPLSFKAALAMTALGSEGDTQRQILDLMGFQTVDQMIAWFSTVLGEVDSFNAYFDDNPNVERGDAAYEVVNSLWKNRDLPGEFTEDYLVKAEELLRAYCDSVSGQGLAAAINNWVKGKTHGLIPELVGDVSEYPAVLVNALYLKSAWVDSFSKIGTDVFTTRSGDKVDKSFMRQTGSYLYYADNDTQLVSVPLRGGVSMVFILGSGENLKEKLAKANARRVEVTIPMFDVETELNNRELYSFLAAKGCTKMLSGQAEFAPMFTESLCVGDVIQKAKVHIDEDGLEAAAATAIITYGSTAIRPESPLVFRADHDFSFCVVSGAERPELLFWGQIVE